MRYFDEVDELDRKKIIWKNIRYNQNNKDYRILITIAYLILNIEIVANNGEELYFKDGTKINEKDLFEKFIREYYIFHYGDKLYVHKTNKEIKWTLTNLETTYLPNLYCDVYLKNKKNDNVLIIEVKCYAGGAFENNDGVLKINSHNIRQIYTYVKNEDKDNTGKVKGLLLYAKADCDPDLNEKFTLDKNEFKVQNLDLSKDFDMVKATLNNIIDEFIISKNM